MSAQQLPPRPVAQPLVLPLGPLALLGLMVANAALAAALPHPAWTLLGLALFVAGVQQLLARAPGAAVMLLPFLVVHFSVLVSLQAIESGAWMKEMGLFGRASPAGAGFVLCSALFLCTAALVFTRRQQRPGPAPAPAAAMAPGLRRLMCAVVLGCAALSVAWLALKGASVGFPLLTGTDRLLFRAQTADILTLNLLNLKYVMAAAVGTSAVSAPGPWWRRAHHAVFGAYLATSFLFGDKFFIVLIAGGFYAMPFLMRRPAGIGARLRALAPAALAMLACAGAVTFFIYSGQGQLSAQETLQRLGERVAGQGQLWFLAVRDSSTLFRLDTGLVALNLQNLLARPPAEFAFEHWLGPYHFVQRYAPTALFQSTLNNNGAATPTIAFEAYSLVLAGYAGLVLALVAAGAWTGWLAHHLARAMASGNAAEVLLPAMAMLQTIVMMSQGTLYSLLSLSSLKQYAACWAVRCLVRAWLAHGAAGPQSQGLRAPVTSHPAPARTP